jgi:hypothetical protein
MSLRDFLATAAWPILFESTLARWVSEAGA